MLPEPCAARIAANLHSVRDLQALRCTCRALRRVQPDARSLRVLVRCFDVGGVRGDWAPLVPFCELIATVYYTHAAIAQLVRRFYALQRPDIVPVPEFVRAWWLDEVHRSGSHLKLRGCLHSTELLNMRGVKSLDARQCTRLWNLETTWCGALQYVDISDCTALSDVTPLARMSGGGVLVMRRCTGVRSVGALRRSGILSLDLQGCTSLNDAEGGVNELTGVQSLVLDDCSGVTRLDEPLADRKSVV